MQLTRILDNVKDADGSPARGKLVIYNPAFIAADGSAVAAGNLTYVIPASSPGLVDLLLAPTAGADPPDTRYRVEYFLRSGVVYAETWQVPASGPVTISQARA